MTPPSFFAILDCLTFQPAKMLANKNYILHLDDSSNEEEEELLESTEELLLQVRSITNLYCAGNEVLQRKYIAGKDQNRVTHSAHTRQEQQKFMLYAAKYGQGFSNAYQMSKQSFMLLLSIIGPSIARKRRGARKGNIKPVLRLSAALRNQYPVPDFLAFETSGLGNKMKEEGVNIWGQ